MAIMIKYHSIVIAATISSCHFPGFENSLLLNHLAFYLSTTSTWWLKRPAQQQYDTAWFIEIFLLVLNLVP